MSVGCKVLGAVAMKSTVFWVVKPCSLEIAKRFGGIHHLHFQGRKSQSAICFLLNILFEPENGSNVLLRKVGLSLNYMALPPRRL
jgi:hypothetical protein